MIPAALYPIAYLIGVFTHAVCLEKFRRFNRTARDKLMSYYKNHLKLYHPKIRWEHSNSNTWLPKYKSNSLTISNTFGCDCTHLANHKKMYAKLLEWNLHDGEFGVLFMGSIIWPIAIPTFMITKLLIKIGKYASNKLELFFDSNILQLSEEQAPGPHLLEAINEVDEILKSESEKKTDQRSINEEIKMFNEQQEKNRLKAIHNINDPFLASDTDKKIINEMMENLLDEKPWHN